MLPRRRLAPLFVALALFGAPKGSRTKPEPHTRSTRGRKTGLGPSTLEGMAAVGAGHM